MGYVHLYVPVLHTGQGPNVLSGDTVSSLFFNMFCVSVFLLHKHIFGRFRVAGAQSSKKNILKKNDSGLCSRLFLKVKKYCEDLY